ncbi:nucleoside phosphorylase domain-containing protein [Aspergillus carlsbadensis]|nr:nucleoside phosphorylase domain-containing protein [Aspergillus carlsbadensis]
MPPRVKRLPHSDYTIGWICAIAVEREAAVAVLDETHKPPLSVAHNDKNTYTLGNIGRHNVVICSLPPGEYGIQAATRVANHMISTFPRIQATLMVGIAGGAPSETTDIRLGDVVVSTPTESSPAVLQYDRGKTMPSGLLSSGILNKPSEMLSSAAVTLRSRHQGNDSVIPQILSEMQAQHPEKWRPPKAVDELFASTYEHSNGEGTCANCDRNKLVQRPVRSGTVPVIHYGLIGSANQVMKHGRTRDELQKKFGILCFEMEAAGLMNDMPCLVIRGICDYSDSHKNKAWQSFAAATAAAYAKELLGVVPLRHQSDSPLSTLGIDFYSRHERERYERQKGSCGWVLRRPEFVRWKEESHRTCSVLWILGRSTFNTCARDESIS